MDALPPLAATMADINKQMSRAIVKWWFYLVGVSNRTMMALAQIQWSCDQHKNNMNKQLIQGIQMTLHVSTWE